MADTKRVLDFNLGRVVFFLLFSTNGLPFSWGLDRRAVVSAVAAETTASPAAVTAAAAAAVAAAVADPSC